VVLMTEVFDLAAQHAIEHGASPPHAPATDSPVEGAPESEPKPDA
jgi:hypothetical protein